MRHLVASVRQAVADKNLYAALGMALTLPDICGDLRAPKTYSSARYPQWCEDYLIPRYVIVMPMTSGAQRSYTPVRGGDIYALRCALLHQGTDDLAGHKAADAVAKFKFVARGPGTETWTIHLNTTGNTLQLQVEEFCEEICAAVDQWLGEVYGVDLDITNRIDALMNIQILDANAGFTI